LNGIRLTLEDDLIGLVIEETKTKDLKQMEIKGSFSEIFSWQLEGSFSEIFSWQLDEPEITHKTDSFCKAMNWMEIAKIVSYLNFNFLI